MIGAFVNRLRYGSTIRIVYVCAWCRQSMPTPPVIVRRETHHPPTADMISHGICHPCAEEFKRN